MHTIILPYFCEAEIDRYEKILEHTQKLGRQSVEFEFLLAASPKLQPSERLLRAASCVAPSRHFQCPSQVFGYPEGASAMFWDCMCHLNDRQDGDGFALWLESDMCPIKPDWMDRLDSHWQLSGDVFVMGCVVPQVNRHRRRFPIAGALFPRQYEHLPWVSQHVNGGACYRRDLVNHMPEDYREGVFDVRLGEILSQVGGYADTPSICFSTMERLRDDLDNPNKALLHGYLQDKDQFLTGCTDPDSLPDTKPRPILPFRRSHPALPQLNAILSVKDCLPPVLTVYRRQGEGTVRSLA